MAQHPLPHYLRTYRRRSGFSQREIGYLLGATSGEKISRYESFNQSPSGTVIFAFEIIFNERLQELFAGIYAEVQREVQARAHRLMAELATDGADRRTTRKLALLNSIVDANRETRRI